MEPTLVLFDVDGTLVDTAGAGRRGLERAFYTVFGIVDVAGPSSRVRFDGKTDPTIIAEIAREAGVPPVEIDARALDLQNAYIEGLREELARPHPGRRTMPGVVPLLEALAAIDGVHLGLLTGNIERGARLKLEPFDLNRFFPDGGFSSDHPDRHEIARIARDRASARTRLRFDPSRISVVGDTELDVACARANGFRAVAVESGWVPRARLEAASPDALLSSLVDLPAVLAALRVA